MQIADKIEQARGEGHGISPHLEEILKSFDARLSELEPQKNIPKPEEPNPLDGVRLDT